MNRILIIEDEKEIAALMEKALNEAGYQTCLAKTGEEGLAILNEKEISLVILDVMLPGINGIAVLEQIRAAFNNVPIIMASAKVQEEDKIRGLKAGADDYIGKPFSLDELIARVESQIRRFVYFNQGMPKEQVLTAKGLTLDEKHHRVELYGKEVKLTPTEYDILWLLLKHKGEVFSSEDIYKKLWAEKYYEGNNTVMSHIWRLRKKIEVNPKKPEIIESVWGVGYTIE